MNRSGFASPPSWGLDVVWIKSSGVARLLNLLGIIFKRSTQFVPIFGRPAPWSTVGSRRLDATDGEPVPPFHLKENSRGTGYARARRNRFVKTWTRDRNLPWRLFPALPSCRRSHKSDQTSCLRFNNAAVAHGFETIRAPRHGLKHWIQLQGTVFVA